MPRGGWIKPESDQRLSDHMAVAMLTTVFPPWLVDEVVAATGRLEQRQRMLPARVVLYHLLAMALYEEASYEEVMRRLLEGLAWQQRWPTGWQLPTKAAIFKARTRLGVEPLAELFERSVHPLARPAAPEASYRDWPLVSVDHHTFELARSTNRGKASESTSAASRAASLRVTALVEGRTHVVLAATFDDSSTAAAGTLAPRLRSRVLYIADDRVTSAALWDEASERGAELLCALDEGWTVTPGDELDDGSRLACVRATTDQRTLRGQVRLIQPIESGSDHDRALLTTLTDPVSAPAHELREIYAGRPTVASCLDDLRVHQHAPTVALRSKSLDGAIQELYGLLLAHYAIRALLTDINLAPLPDARRAASP